MITGTNMNSTEQIIHIGAGHFDVNLLKLKDFLMKYLSKHALNALIAFLLVYVIFTKDVHFSVHLNNDSVATTENGQVAKANFKQKNKKQNGLNSETAMASFIQNDDPDGDGIVELLPVRKVKPLVNPIEAVRPPSNQSGNEANTFDNVSVFENPEKATPSVLKSKHDKCWDYVTRYINIAKAERTKFGIPTSITLAQGLLESDAGDSRLTRKANNHFGVKTFKNSVAHVVMKDDTPKDKFRIYDSAWESYRDHSLVLMRNHYKHLQFLSKNDYAGWAKGLQKAGYATDKRYAEKLIKIIENLKLYRFDEA